MTDIVRYAYPYVYDRDVQRRMEESMGCDQTVFDRLSLDRDVVHWEDYLDVLTPIHLERNTDGREMFFKRDDFFAPLGYHGINGSKLRQAIYLFSTYAMDRGHVVNGAFVNSIQLPLCALCGRHFGKKVTAVLGHTTPDKCRKYEMVDMSYRIGCEFDFVSVGYNNSLQRRCREILSADPESTFYLEYGTSLDIMNHTPVEIYDFHHVAARQTMNIPYGMTDIVIPAGNCSSAAGILLGLCENGFRDIKRVHLVGIGPSKTNRLAERLEVMSGCSVDCCVYDGLPYTMKISRHRPIQTYFYDLHGEHYCQYNDEMPFQFGSIDLHPTYEGKVMTYIYERMPELVRSTTLFWIVGNKPRKEVVLPYV